MLIGRKCEDAKGNIYTIVSQPLCDPNGIYVVVELDGRLRPMFIDEVHLVADLPNIAGPTDAPCVVCGKNDEHLSIDCPDYKKKLPPPVYVGEGGWLHIEYTGHSPTVKKWPGEFTGSDSRIRDGLARGKEGKGDVGRG